MTTMQKFKAYFGMVPPNDYDDDYFDEPGDAPALSARERAYMEKYRSNSMRDEALYDDDYRDELRREEIRRDELMREELMRGELREPEYRSAGYRDIEFEAPVRGAAPRASRPYGVSRHLADGPAPRRLEPLDRPSVRGANAIAPEPRMAPESRVAESRVAEPRMAEPRMEVDPMGDAAGKISTLRPADYSEARTIGERYRDGNPVIMDLVDMSNDDAKRLVDFAAGLAFAARGSLEKVATKVFLLSPAGIDVTPEQRRRIAEKGFSNQV